MKNKKLKKVLKIFTYTIIILLIIISVCGISYYNHWRNSNTVNTFTEFTEPENVDYNEIYWKSDSLGNTIMEKTAFFVKIKIVGIEGYFYMQFDTGTPKTIFYGSTLTRVLKTKSAKKIEFTKDSTQIVKNIKIQIGKTTFFTNRIDVKPDFGSDILDTAFTVIGTIGFDALVGRTLILDFKSDKIAFTKKPIKELGFSTIIVKDASVNRFPLLIPALMDKKKIRLFYDTGSSMFSLLTSTKKLKEMKSESGIDTLCCVRNWKNLLPVYRRKTHSKIDFNGIKSENDYVYGININMINFLNYMPESFIYGMTGNKLFSSKIIVVDNKNNEFGISE